MLKKQKVVVFDFDGTLNGRDANAEFMKYCFRRSIRPWLFLPAVIFGAMISLLDKKDTRMKKRPFAKLWREIMRCYLSEKMVQRLSPDFIKQHKKLRFAWSKPTVAAARAKDVMVILISAGPDYLIPHLVKDMGFDVILTTDTQKHKPWKLNFLCWGDNKVLALKKWAKNNKVQPVVLRAYGDSYGDIPLLSMAKEAIWVDHKTGNRVFK